MVDESSDELESGLTKKQTKKTDHSAFYSFYGHALKLLPNVYYLSKTHVKNPTEIITFMEFPLDVFLSSDMSLQAHFIFYFFSFQ